MKRTIFRMIVVCMLLNCSFLSSEAKLIVPPTATDSTSLAVAEGKSIIKRLEEIKAIDKSKLNSAEKKELRKEVKTLKERLRHVHGGVYVSAGAVILILILLIILV